MATFEELEQLILEHGGLVNRIRKEQKKQGIKDYRGEVMDAHEKIGKRYGKLTDEERRYSRDMKKSYSLRTVAYPPGKRTLKANDYKPWKTAEKDAEGYDKEYDDAVNGYRNNPKDREKRLKDLKQIPKGKCNDRDIHDAKMAKIESNGNPNTSYELEVLRRQLKAYENTLKNKPGDKATIDLINSTKRKISQEEKKVQKLLKAKSKKTKKQLKDFRKEQQKNQKAFKEYVNETKLLVYESGDRDVISREELLMLLDYLR